MPAIDIQKFSGLVPRQSPRQMGDNNAQVATNARLSSGAVEGWREKKLSSTLTILGEVQTIFKFPDGKWLQFNEDVDIVGGPVAGDTTDRHYLTGLNKPRVINSTLADVSSPASGVITGATQANPCVITDVAHGLSTGMVQDIASVVGMVELNGNRYKVTVITADTYSLDDVDSSAYTAYTSGGTWTRIEDIYPEDSYVVGVPAPTTAPTAALNGTHTTPVSTAYVYTFVNDWGEESAPSPVSNIVAADFSTGTVDLTTMDAAPASYLDYVPITKWRIYRVATGTTGADYLFVAEVTINVSSPQYNDTALVTALAEILPSTDWDTPPDGLTGLTAMANGILAGFVGNTVYFCEPFLPYAWPDKYTLVVESDIISMGAFGSSLVVATDEKPSMITGSHPTAMSMEKLPYPHPCVAKRGMVEVEGGVIYPAADGLFYVGSGGSRLITKDFYTRREWQDLSPNSIIGTWYDNRYFAWFPTQSNVLEFQPAENELTNINMGGDVTAFYVDPADDSMYFCLEESSVNKIYQFAGEATRMTFTWRSKKFEMPMALTPTAARIIGDFDVALTASELTALTAAIAAALAANEAKIAAGTLDGSVNANMVNEYEVNGDDMEDIPPLPSETTYSFKLYSDGELVHSGTFSNNNPIRLPSGYRARTLEIELSGQFQCHRVLVGTSIQDVMR